MTTQVQVSIPYFTSIPSDVVTNTWYFESLAGQPVNAARAALVFANLEAFYESVFAGASTGQLAPHMRPLQTVMKMYDLTDPAPRTAVLEATVPLTCSTSTTAALPTEVAIVLSYHTEYASGINKGSQRGRVYLGGLGDACFTPGNSTQFPAVKTSLCSHIGDRAQALAADSLADDWGWAVYSRKLGQEFAVAGGWVDNAFDTQRRRGQTATVRDLWTD